MAAEELSCRAEQGCSGGAIHWRSDLVPDTIASPSSRFELQSHDHASHCEDPRERNFSWNEPSLARRTYASAE
jgi:hypothetical protein